MIIALDIRGLSGNPAGKGVWTKYVLEAMLNDSDHSFFLLTDQKDSSYSSRPNVHVIYVEGSGFFWHFKAYQALLQNQVDVFLATESYLIPYLHDPKKLKVALVVHDLVAFKSPSKHQKKAMWIERMSLKRAVKKSRFIFTVSESTKKDLIEHYSSLHLKKKTLVVYAGVRPEFLRPIKKGEILSTRKKFKLNSDYLLMASTLEPRKNIDGMIEAYSNLPEELRVQFPLLIAGKKGWYFESIFKKVSQLECGGQIHFLGYVSDEDLNALMRGATAFLFPSFYEGFGLPVGEAMACGTPVLTSKVSSLPEVGGAAVCYVDPYDTMSMKNGLEKLIIDSNYRQDLIENGKKHIQQFTWKKTAALILDRLR